MRILLFIKNQLIKEGLLKVFAEQNDFEVIEVLSNQESLFSVLSNNNDIDIIVYNVSYPNKNDIDLISDLHIQFPQIRLLILGALSIERFAIKMLKAGASAFLTEQTSIEELIYAINKIMSGAKYIETILSERISLRAIDSASNLPHEKLSEREFEVMKMIASGKKISNIANELSLSINTVSTYRARLVEKLNIKSTADIVRYVLEHNLL